MRASGRLTRKSWILTSGAGKPSHRIDQMRWLILSTTITSTLVPVLPGRLLMSNASCRLYERLRKSSQGRSSAGVGSYKVYIFDPVLFYFRWVSLVLSLLSSLLTFLNTIIITVTITNASLSPHSQSQSSPSLPSHHHHPLITST